MGSRNRQPTFFDFVKAAFHARLPMPVMGGLPLNYLFLALMGGASVAFPPVALFGAAAEIAFLATLSNNPRFQRAVRARMLRSARDEDESGVEQQVTQLRRYAKDYATFAGRCQEIADIARSNFGPTGNDAYEASLRDLRVMYARLLHMREVLEDHASPGSQEQIKRRIEQMKAQIADPNVPASTKEAEQQTLEILQKRLDTRAQIDERMRLILAEQQRLDEQVQLLKDEVILTRDPTVLSENVTAAASMIEEQSEWFKNNAMLLEQADTMRS